ncbi:Glycos_transf_1 domain-containing protein [Rubrivivax sp. A210]|uniref:glycosyltransferase family 4 protein n=1 Tax=Rubrivivax sp. A210 TaxID=2772301 RepID=UPI00191B5579|nr:glycosyltransferase family 4 protein [Rubrivivax sp. A210]CAD5369190.1 Glycos_transf_1 domain-containing protein [Rubrivivax sp. A210]
MKVVVSVNGKFHCFDLARELHARGALQAIFTGYPRFKLRNERLPKTLVHTFPYLLAPYMGLPLRRWLGESGTRKWEWLMREAFDRHVARNLPDCDVFVGLSSSGLQTARRARSMGIRYVCDRGSTHIRVQNSLLRDEHAIWGQPYLPIDAGVMEREEAEYAEADCITVPSSYTRRTFIDSGVPAERVHRLSYGVDLSRFQSTGQANDQEFRVLFVGGMSLRKGVPYLLDAYAKLVHPKKSLTFAGSVASDVIALMRRHGLWVEDAKVLGHVPQDQLKDLMSRSHVLVLPSIEEGLALVQAQAMACGCVVVASRHTGAEDLFEDGEEGFIVSIRDADALAGKMQLLADRPELRRQMSAKATQCVQKLGGWKRYGEQAHALYRGLLA